MTLTLGHTSSTLSILTKKAHDAPSRLWDDLINMFSSHIINGTIIAEKNESISTNEFGVRLMAHESRFRRRILSRHLAECHYYVHDGDRHARIICNPDNPSEMPYIILHTKQTERMSSQNYLDLRIALLEAYCICFLDEYFPVYSQVVGLGFNYGNQPLAGNSEDICALEIPPSDIDELRVEASQLRKQFGIFKQNRMKKNIRLEKEYPDVDEKELSTGWIRTPKFP